LPVSSKEITEQRGAFLLPDAGVDLHPVVEAALAKDVEHRTGGPCFLVPCPEDHTGNSCQDNGSGAHGTGLQGHHESAVRQPPAVTGAASRRSQRLQTGGGLTDRNHLGVRRRITVRLPFVPPGTQHLAVGPHDDGADRHVLSVQCPPRLLEGKAHPLGMARIRGSHGSMIVSKIRQAQTMDELGRRSENLD
jgi:hypothetical protein